MSSTHCLLGFPRYHLPCVVHSDTVQVPSSKTMVLGPEADLCMFSMLVEQGAHKGGSHGPDNVGQRRDIFLPLGPLYSVLQHL